MGKALSYYLLGQGHVVTAIGRSSVHEWSGREKGILSQPLEDPRPINCPGMKIFIISQRIPLKRGPGKTGFKRWMQW